MDRIGKRTTPIWPHSSLYSVSPFVGDEPRHRIQSAYYIATGMSPFVSMRAFEAITGPKTDRWLVRMVGLLAIVIGLELRRGDRRQLAVSSAASFAAIDVFYVLARRIRPIYLLDAMVELWFICRVRSRHE